jgi:hypothetical protein
MYSKTTKNTEKRSTTDLISKCPIVLRVQHSADLATNKRGHSSLSILVPPKFMRHRCKTTLHVKQYGESVRYCTGLRTPDRSTIIFNVRVLVHNSRPPRGLAHCPCNVASSSTMTTGILEYSTGTVIHTHFLLSSTQYCTQLPRSLIPPNSRSRVDVHCT